LHLLNIISYICLNKQKQIESMEVIYIKFRNKEKNFSIDTIEFSGENKFNEAIEWGKKNISNFNLDMINWK